MRNICAIVLTETWLNSSILTMLSALRNWLHFVLTGAAHSVLNPEGVVYVFKSTTAGAKILSLSGAIAHRTFSF